MTRVAVVTHQTSPYQVELFDAVGAAQEVALHVVYLRSSHPTRQWVPPAPRHPHTILDEAADRLPPAEAQVLGADLAVLNYYRHPFAYRLIQRRAAGGKAWCFWGERPGVSRWANLGGLYRRWKLRALHRSRAPVWGIGAFAVEKYRGEFGGRRAYVNLPYFSNLARFAAVTRPAPPAAGALTFLYSGSLIRRKGVDLLARAFVRLAAEFPCARLRLVGDGECRAELETVLAPVAGRVEFAGFQDWNALPAQYGDAHVLVAPSRHDGWALVVPEGLAAGLPVIATDRMGAALDLLAPDGPGWRVPAGEEAPLHQAMRAALQCSPADWSARSQAARAAVARHQLADGVARFHAACRQAVAGWTA